MFKVKGRVLSTFSFVNICLLSQILLKCILTWGKENIRDYNKEMTYYGNVPEYSLEVTTHL